MTTSTAAAPRSRQRPQNPFRVLLQHRNFRLYWLGQTGSQIGTWVQAVARGWLALQLSNSAFVVAFVGFAGSIPVLVLTLYAGALADRYDKLRLVRITQSLFLIQGVVLWWFVWSGHITIAWLVALSLANGSVNAFDIPSRQALIVELVGKEDLVNAIALNSSGFNLARVIGPAIGGVLIKVVGLAWCFALDAVSYLAVLIGLFMIVLPPLAAAAAAVRPLEGIRQGITYMRETRVVAQLMRLVAVVSVFSVPYLVLMPVEARNVLHRGAGGYGALLTSVGVGAFLGALALAGVGQNIPRGRVFAWSTCTFAALLIVFSFIRTIWLAIPVLVLVGLSMIVTTALANALIQTEVPDALRGRIMAAYAFVFVGMAPLGYLLLGFMAKLANVSVAIALGAAVTLLFALWEFGTHPEVRML
ncbi:MAG TPA: MFS transporter [Gemmatimonadaceae bacterium]|nr:MFS transporter [Gemmatimonadaceae bacterium]